MRAVLIGWNATLATLADLGWQVTDVPGWRENPSPEHVPSRSNLRDGVEHKVLVGPGGVAVVTRLRFSWAQRWSVSGRRLSDPAWLGALATGASIWAGQLAATLPPERRLHVRPVLCLPRHLTGLPVEPSGLPDVGRVRDTTVCSLSALPGLLGSWRVVADAPVVHALAGVLASSPVRRPDYREPIGGPPPRPETHVVPSARPGEPPVDAEVTRLLLLLLIVLFVAGGGVSATRDFVSRLGPHPAATYQAPGPGSARLGPGQPAPDLPRGAPPGPRS